MSSSITRSNEKPLCGLEQGQPRLLQRRVVVGGHAVDAGHLVAVGQQAAGRGGSR
jgi:hypothetical protein